MTWTEIVDAWVTELQNTVPGLADAVVHRYASWSVEALVAERGERHLAIWPEAEAESLEGLTTGAGGGSDLATQSYVVLAWEDASTEGGRLMDDDTANAAWLDLHEAIRARFLTSANLRLGSSAIMDTRYRAAAFDMVGLVRTMALRFTVRLPLTWT
jgi:hypothetical protein